LAGRLDLDVEDTRVTEIEPSPVRILLPPDTTLEDSGSFLTDPMLGTLAEVGCTRPRLIPGGNLSVPGGVHVLVGLEGVEVGVAMWLGLDWAASSSCRESRCVGGMGGCTGPGDIRPVTGSVLGLVRLISVVGVKAGGEL